MQNIASKTKDEILKIRDEYIAKYIGDFDKPYDYKSTLKLLNRTIEAKG